MIEIDDPFLSHQRMARIVRFIRYSTRNTASGKSFGTTIRKWEMDIDNIPFSMTYWDHRLRFQDDSGQPSLRQQAMTTPKTQTGYLFEVNDWACKIVTYDNYRLKPATISVKNVQAMRRDMMVIRMGTTMPSWVWDMDEPIPPKCVFEI